MFCRQFSFKKIDLFLAGAVKELNLTVCLRMIRRNQNILDSFDLTVPAIILGNQYCSTIRNQPGPILVRAARQRDRFAGVPDHITEVSGCHCQLQAPGYGR